MLQLLLSEVVNCVLIPFPVVAKQRTAAVPSGACSGLWGINAKGLKMSPEASCAAGSGVEVLPRAIPALLEVLELSEEGG